MMAKHFFNPILSKTNKRLSFEALYSTLPAFKEQKIRIRNYEINYLKVGRGDHHLFCAAGMFGTIWSDYKKQIEGFDQDKFSLVVWDPPGFGKSVALDKKDAIDVFFAQTDFVYEFMKALEIPRYSLLGWSSGATACLLLADRYSEVVNKVVVFGTSSFVTPREIQYYKNLNNLNNWPKPTKEAMIKLYGEEILKNKINQYVKQIVDFHNANRSLDEHIKRIKCPTFILHGAKDSVVSVQHLKHLENLIPNSRTHLYPEGGHNIQIQYADDFNKRVQEFLLEPSEKNTTRIINNTMLKPN